ncbi:thermonuclease family protein [Intrasporangium calvum]|uniref:Thermonuclease family protein n=1 Tax=Intrasporangium calvum TaxID=53358 RepID=A0ABT5GKZ8_9MICO|nr:thermonuclease family protein [Intrasporangium calvum]MDC5698918.1 thermonuclease family protein [Intrasporangium calvum]
MSGSRRSRGARRGLAIAITGVAVGVLSQCAQPTLLAPSDLGSTTTTPAGAPTSASTSASPAQPVPAAKPPATRTAAPKPTASAKPAPTRWEVTWVVDGDTIHVSRGGDVVKVRLIGIDTPERDECGYQGARDSLRRIIAGRAVTLEKGARTSQDQYGRLLRYVRAGGTDVGLAQIKSGFAVARFDSRDGYGSHPREDAYIAADRQSADRGWACAEPAPVKPQTGWPLPGDEHPCPQGRPIKGNESSMIAHSPGQQSYLVTNPEQCFATLSDAVAAGYRPAKR